MRSSRGGCVAKRRLSLAPECPGSVSSGDSIHRCAVALDDVSTTVLSTRSFSSAEMSPRRVGEQLAAAADGELHQAGDYRGEHEQDHPEDREHRAERSTIHTV